MQVSHHFADAGQDAQIQCAILLIDQAAGADLDDLQAWQRLKRVCFGFGDTTLQKGLSRDGSRLQ